VKWKSDALQVLDRAKKPDAPAERTLVNQLSVLLRVLLIGEKSIAYEVLICRLPWEGKLSGGHGVRRARIGIGGSKNVEVKAVCMYA
jgi:hypothetical protein